MGLGGVTETRPGRRPEGELPGVGEEARAGMEKGLQRQWHLQGTLVSMLPPFFFFFWWVNFKSVIFYDFLLIQTISIFTYFVEIVIKPCRLQIKAR